MIRPDFAHSASAKKKPRTTPYIVLTLLLLVMLAFFFENEIRRLTQFGEGRKLLVQCIHNMYATSNQAAVDMPKPPAVTIEKETSSSMAICQEWIRRRAQNNIIPVYTQEDDTVCMDWTSPHYRVLEIVAASILDRLNDYSRYRHDCYRSRTWDEAVTGYDRTTVQQLLPVARMGPNHDLLNISEALTQCKVCLDNFDAVNEDRRVKTFAYHHCFAWPQEWEEHTWIAEVDSGGVYGDKIALPHNATKPNTVPLTSVFTQIRRRLQHAARTFANVTHAPPDERDSGVVIWLDAGTTGIPQDAYPYYFPDSPTSITVLSSPLCATALLPTGERCYEYAEGLVSYFQTLYPGLTNTGYGGLNGIQFQMSTSSAGSWSRMIRSKILICPPTSPNCLLPASAKEYDLAAGIETQAYVLDIPSSGKAIEFFTLVGHWDRVVVERLSDMPVVRRALMRELVNISAPRTSTDEEAAPIFLEVNEDVNDEGYPPLHEPAPLITQSEAQAKTDNEIRTAVEPELPSNVENDNIYFPEFERPVSGAAVDQAVAQGLPININYFQMRETNRRATEEMAVDGETSMTSRAYVADPGMAQLRTESQERIRGMKQEATLVEGLKASPSTEMEIFCPLVTGAGYAVDYDKGTVEITKNDEVVVSDGAGTAVFDKSDMEKQEMFNDRDDEGNPYTEIYDPTARKMVRLNGTDILINSEGAGVVKRGPTGVLYVDNTTTPYTATLVTEGATGNLDNRRMGDTHKKYTGTIIQTGQNRVKKGDVVRHGRGYAVQDTPEIGTRRSIYGWWNGFYSSKSASSSESGGSGYQGSYAHHYRPAEVFSSSEEGGTSDSRDIGLEVEDSQLVNQTDEMVRHLGEKVSIKVPIQEFRRFGERRVCQNYRERVLKQQRQLKKQPRNSEHKTELRTTEIVNIDRAPARRKISS